MLFRKKHWQKKFKKKVLPLLLLKAEKHLTDLQ
jgi:hypothetical protein